MTSEALGSPYPQGGVPQQEVTVHLGGHTSDLTSSTSRPQCPWRWLQATTAKHGDAKGMCHLAQWGQTNVIVTGSISIFLLNHVREQKDCRETRITSEIKQQKTFCWTRTSVFKSYMWVFEKGRKITFGYTATWWGFMLTDGQRMGGGSWIEAFEQEPDPPDRMCWPGSEGHRELEDVYRWGL